MTTEPLVNYTQLDPSTITADGNNPNVMTKRQMEALKKNIKRYGFLVPVVVNNQHVIADGEHRWQAARELGMKSIPCVVVNVNDIDRILLRQILNKFRGEHDRMLDVQEYRRIIEAGESGSLRELLALNDADYQAIIDSVLAKPEKDYEFQRENIKPRILPGEIWQLGNHRLACDDSTKPETLTKLMAGERATMVFTDPPYNLAFNATTDKNPVFENDKLSPAEYQDFTAKWIHAAMTAIETSTAWYVCIDWRHVQYITNELENAGHSIKNTIVWAKQFGGLGYRYRFRHEFIVYSEIGEPLFQGEGVEEDVWELEVNRKEGSYHLLTQAPQFVGIEGSKTFLKVAKSLRTPERGKIHIVKSGSKVRFQTNKDAGTDVWEFSSANSFDFRQTEGALVHPTMKPVQLCERAIRNNSLEGQIVLDPFAGSGSTLIAGENMRRKVYAIEIDPHYCELIIQRWENHTGLKATKLE